MKRLIFIIGISILSCISMTAQNKYLPLRGKVVSDDSLSPVPNVHILSEISYFGTTSDFNGRFSMQIKENDSLRVSCIGFVTKIIAINYDSINVNNFEIMMERDTIILEEIDFNPYYDFNTIKEIVRNAPIEKPFIVKGVNENIEDVIWQKPRENPRANIIQNPVQAIYNRFNKKARLKRKLERNRKKYGGK